MANKKSVAANNDMTMKVVLVVALVIAFVGGYLVARAKYKPQILELTKMVMDKDQTIEKLKADANRVVVKDGVVWVIQNGLMSQLENEMTLNSGDKVNSEGKVIRKDGTEVMLQEGDSADMEGNIVKSADEEMESEDAQSF